MVPMKKINDLFFRLAEFTLVIMLSAMVIMVFGNVVLRYGFNDGIISSEELSRFLFIWITFLGAIVTMRDNAHLGLDSVVRKLSLSGKKIAFGISNVLMLMCCVLMFYGTFKQHGINATTRSGVTELPMSWGVWRGLHHQHCHGPHDHWQIGALGQRRIQRSRSHSSDRL